MFNHKNQISSLRTPMTIAALSILLAACGGGGSDDNGTQATSGRVNGTASGNTNSTASGNASAAATTTVNVAANNATPATRDAGDAAAPDATNTPSPASDAGSSDTTPGTSPAPETPRATDDDAAAPNSAEGNTPPAQDDNGASGGTAPANSAAPGGNATPNNTAPAASSTPAGPVAAISSQGVRGDVLLALMEQSACMQHYIWENSSLLRGGVRNSGAPHVGQTSVIRGDSSYRYDYSVWERFPTMAPFYVANCGRPDVRRYTSLKPGNYTFEMISNRTWEYKPYFPTGFTRGFNTAGATYALNVTADQVGISGNIKLQLAEDLLYTATGITAGLTGRSVETELNAEALSFRRDALVPFGTLRLWQDNDGNRVRLMLIAGDTPDQAKLCTDFNTSLAKRLHCKTWHVAADWQWGQELKGPNVYVIDDRSVYPNESGNNYWGYSGHYYGSDD
ncbi:MAG: hypothetical protein Q4D19_10830 [Lautropia sp.]|nr:hypothetical protein [Lautropia sp.]